MAAQKVSWPILIIMAIISRTFALSTGSGSSDFTNTQKQNGSVPTQLNTSSLSGLTVLFILISLAVNATMQRSGSDEMPVEGSLSMARTSPFICIADIAVAFTTIAYGYRRGLDFQGSCALYIANSRRTSPQVEPLISNRTVADVVFFCAGSIGAFKIWTTHDADVRVVIWTSFYYAAPIVHLILRMFAEDPEAQRQARQLLDRTAMGDTLIEVADYFWCLAYAVQFFLWVAVFQEVAALPQLSGQNATRTNIVITCSILTAISMSWFSPRRLFQYWAIRNWKGKEWGKFGIAIFVAAVAQGAPDSPEALQRWRNYIFLPLGAFSMVVIELWLMTVVADIFDLLRRRLQAGRGPLPAPVTRNDGVDPRLEDRINPLLSTAPEWWRRTLMLTFGSCQLTFAALNYTLLYRPGDSSVPDFADGFGG